MQTYYIHPKGNDQNDGSASAPFRTVNRALSEAEDNTEIIVADGTYHEYDTWDITASNITIRAADGTQPIISGGVSVTGWKPAGDPQRLGLMCAPLPEPVIYARNFYINGCRAERVHGPVLANDGWNLTDNPNMRFMRKIDEVEYNGKMLGVYEGYAASDLTMLNWRNKSDIEFVYDVGWTHCIVPVDDITADADGKAFVKMRNPCFRHCQTKGGVQIGSPSYIENAYELLGTPGQWYIDRAERVIYYTPRDGEDIAAADCVLPVNEKFINIAGTIDNPVENIKISGLTFMYSSWLKPSAEGYAEVQANMLFDEPHGEKKANSAISLSMCGNVCFEHCRFTHIGASAIDMDKGVYAATVNACKFEDISGSGIQIGGFGEADAHPVDPREMTHRIIVSNNHITGVGTEFKGAVGVIAGYVSDVNITHNEIEHCSYSGVSLGWGWGLYDPDNETRYVFNPDPRYVKYDKPTVCMRNSVTYNHIHHVMEKLHDGAGIYTLGLQNGSIIRGNYIHDNAFSGERGNVAQCVQPNGFPEKIELYGNDGKPLSSEGYEGPPHGFPGGIYLDEASGGFYVSENVVHSVAVPFFHHDTGVKGRRDSNFVFDNSFNVYPEADDFPVELVGQAGILPEYE